MGQTVKVTVRDVTKEYPAGVSLQEICRRQMGESASECLLAVVNGKLCELFKTIHKDCQATFLTYRDSAGHKTYARGMTMLLLTALTHLYGKEASAGFRVEHRLGDGIYCESEKLSLTEEVLEALRAEMERLVKKDYAIEKKSMNTSNAIALFAEEGMTDKVRLLRYRRSSKMNVYYLDGYMDYFYGHMPVSTGCLNRFALRLYREGMLLMLPSALDAGQVSEPVTREKLYATLQEANHWGRAMGIETVGDLNAEISKGRMEDLILLQEALQERKLSELAEAIAARKDCKFVMIAGPSSSGKTTFSHRLSIQLRSLGLRPHPIGLDNYYKDRELAPKNPDGTYDLECLDALDVPLFNEQMSALLNGETVSMPEFNFKTGKSERRGKLLTLGADDILVIEGIHGLNDALSYSLPKESKFKVYISALTELNLDSHNRISTTDGRLLRRIVRDAKARGTSAKDTIAMWPSVRHGEENYIFPFQEDADYMFNSALIYELSVLKQYAEPLLFGIPEECEEWLEAKRLLKFLDYFLGIPTDDIPKNSILREFIGGSCFPV
ncbi:MAG: nucleoside kinase [Lachnospiraceae bacterium]|nr:nucleoside kinase [Lachnospiraceae bacterium]